jgi:hypothetical protein
MNMLRRRVLFSISNWECLENLNSTIYYVKTSSTSVYRGSHIFFSVVVLFPFRSALPYKLPGIKASGECFIEDCNVEDRQKFVEYVFVAISNVLILRWTGCCPRGPQMLFRSIYDRTRQSTFVLVDVRLEKKDMVKEAFFGKEQTVSYHSLRLGCNPPG